MVRPFLVLSSYVVISTLVGCLGAFQLYTFVPRDGGIYTLTAENRWQFDENSGVDLVIYGSKLTSNTTMLVFVSKSNECTDRVPLNILNSSDSEMVVNGTLPSSQQTDDYFICVINNENSEDVETKTLPFAIKNLGFSLPIYLRIVASCFLLCLSGLFSGLNLGLMSLDLTSLRILIETGNPQEKRDASMIEPIRKQGNFLLCTLLLGNVLVNNTLTILLDTLFGGLFAIIGATAGIVVMGEIIPQAICQRFGLVVGAKTLFITKIFMVLTGPISWPISKLLDVLLGEELGVFYRREQLKQLLMLTQGQHGIHKDEVTMITGVLSINEKFVKEIMTDINDVYMLDIDTKITFEVMQDIVSKGFSRIPVYENDENNIVGLLFVKDLAFVDPDDELPLQSVIKFYSHPAHTVLGDMKVLQLMQDFMTERYHMAIVAEIEESSDNSNNNNNNKPRRSNPASFFARRMSAKSLSLIGMSKTVPDNEVLDNRYIPIGVVTLEDIIEEIIQQEIVDETDAYVTNDFKKKNEKKQLAPYPFAKDKSSAVLKISPQLQLATFTFLSTQIPEFSEEYISANVLNKLLRQDVIKEAQPGGKAIVEAGKAIDAMIMILSGEMKIEIGMEKMQFIQGPFSCFCIPALVGSYVPDVTVVPSDVVCQYLCICRDDYKRAIEATKITCQEQEDKPNHRPSVRPSTASDHHSSAPSVDEHRPSVEVPESDRLLESDETDKLLV